MKIKDTRYLKIAGLALLLCVLTVPVFYLCTYVTYLLHFVVPYNAVMMGLLIGFGFKGREIWDRGPPSEAKRQERETTN